MQNFVISEIVANFLRLINYCVFNRIGYDAKYIVWK